MTNPRAVRQPVSASQDRAADSAPGPVMALMVFPPGYICSHYGYLKNRSLNRIDANNPTKPNNHQAIESYQPIAHLQHVGMELIPAPFQTIKALVDMKKVLFPRLFRIRQSLIDSFKTLVGKLALSGLPRRR